MRKRKYLEVTINKMKLSDSFLCTSVYIHINKFIVCIDKNTQVNIYSLKAIEWMFKVINTVYLNLFLCKYM